MLYYIFEKFFGKVLKINPYFGPQTHEKSVFINYADGFDNTVLVSKIVFTVSLRLESCYDILQGVRRSWIRILRMETSRTRYIFAKVRGRATARLAFSL